MEQASLTTAMQMMQNAMQMMQNAMQIMQNLMQNDAKPMQNMQNDAKPMQTDANLHKTDAKPHAKCSEHVSQVRRAAALKRWHGADYEKLMQTDANSANDANLHILHDFVGKENENEKEKTPFDNPPKEKDKEKEKDDGEVHTPAHTCEPAPADEHTGVRARKDGAIHVEDLDKQPSASPLSPFTFHLSPPTHLRRIIPPTVEMVKAYCRSRQNGIDAEAFVDFYASRGWMVGKIRMKDWQAAVRTWEHRRREEQQKQTNLNNNRYDNTHTNQQNDLAGNAADRKPYSRVQELANTRFALD